MGQLMPGAMDASTLITIKRLQKLFIFFGSSGILFFQVSILIQIDQGNSWLVHHLQMDEIENNIP